MNSSNNSAVAPNLFVINLNNGSLLVSIFLSSNDLIGNEKKAFALIL